MIFIFNDESSVVQNPIIFIIERKQYFTVDSDRFFFSARIEIRRNALPAFFAGDFKKPVFSRYLRVRA